MRVGTRTRTLSLNEPRRLARQQSSLNVLCKNKNKPQSVLTALAVFYFIRHQASTYMSLVPRHFPAKRTLVYPREVGHAEVTAPIPLHHFRHYIYYIPISSSLPNYSPSSLCCLPVTTPKPSLYTIPWSKHSILKMRGIQVSKYVNVCPFPVIPSEHHLTPHRAPMNSP